MLKFVKLLVDILLGPILISWFKSWGKRYLFSIWAVEYFAQKLSYGLSYKDRGSLGDKGWKQLTACLNSAIFNRPKKNLNLFRDFGADKIFTTCWSLSDCRVQVLSPGLSPFLSSGIHSIRLFQKIIKGFDCKINGQALGGMLRHNSRMIGLVRLASTSTGCFLVCSSCCQPSQASLLSLRVMQV